VALFIADAGQYYTREWLRVTAMRAGLSLTEDPDAATMFWATVSDVEELKSLRKLRGIAGNRPIVAGGLEASTGNGLSLAYADACVCGEGEEFILTCGDKGIDEALRLPCVVRRDDPMAQATPSTVLSYENAPLVQSAKHVWYCLAARGCPNKCSFCMTSWGTQYSAAHPALLRGIANKLRAERPGDQVMYITNYSTGLPKAKRGAQSFMVRDYIANPAETQGLSLVRLGIEGFTEQRREWFRKPIADADIYRAIEQAQRLKQTLHLFFIVGWPDANVEWHEFCANCIPTNLAKHPWIWLKFTYFEPCAFTPMYRYDMTQQTEFDSDRAFCLARARSRAMYLHSASGPMRPLWRTVLRRARWEHADVVPKSQPNTHPDEFIAEMHRRGLGYTISPQPSDELPGERLNMPFESARRKRAIEMGIEQETTQLAVG